VLTPSLGLSASIIKMELRLAKNINRTVRMRPFHEGREEHREPNADHNEEQQ
jgi:hypothetical protein